jgi:hypothetical protein
MKVQDLKAQRYGVLRSKGRRRYVSQLQEIEREKKKKKKKRERERIFLFSAFFVLS